MFWQSKDLGLALHKGVQEVGQGQVSQGIAVVDNGRPSQQLPRHSGHAGVRV